MAGAAPLYACPFTACTAVPQGLAKGDVVRHLEAAHLAERFDPDEVLPPEPVDSEHSSAASTPPQRSPERTRGRTLLTPSSSPERAKAVSAMAAPASSTPRAQVAVARLGATASTAAPSGSGPPPAAAAVASSVAASGRIPQSYFDSTRAVLKLKVRRNGWVVCPFDTMHTVRGRLVLPGREGKDNGKGRDV